MKNNSENKLKFFACYLGQMVLKNKKSPEITILNGHFFYHSVPYLENYHLELRSIESITDDECLEFYNKSHALPSLEYEDFVKIDHIRFLIQQERYLLKLTDFLRSKGFLVPFMNLTTDQILEFGWAKIKE